MKHLVAKISVMAFLLLIPSLATAQPEETTRTCRVIFPERSNGAPSEAYIFDGEKSHKILLPSLNFSEVVELPGGDITISMTPEPILDKEELPENAPKATIPASQTDFYLVVFDDSANEVLPVKIRPISIDKDVLKVGETIWLNFSDLEIAAKLGNTKVLINPKNKAISKPPLNTSGYYLAQFYYKGKEQDSFSPIMKKSWWFDANSKNLGFIISSGARLPKIFTIRDRRSPDTSTQQQQP